MNKEIEGILIPWCKEMVSKYEWLTIKYELSSKYGLYIVSFSPVSEIDKCDEFNLEVMKFEDDMNAHYGNKAPLFCDEERNFVLSENATILGAKANVYVTVRLNLVQMSYSQSVSANSFSKGYVNSKTYYCPIIIAA